MKRFACDKLPTLKLVFVLFILLLFVVGISFKTFAGDISLSLDNVEVNVGSGTTIELIGNSVAGLCSISSADESICTAEMEGEGWIEDENVKIVIYGNSPGTTTVYVNYQVGDFDDEEALYEGSFPVTVSVTENLGDNTASDEPDAQSDTEPIITAENDAAQVQIQTEEQDTDVTLEKQNDTVTENVTGETEKETIAEDLKENQNESQTAQKEKTVKVEENKKTIWPVIGITAAVLIVTVGVMYVVARFRRKKRKRRRRRNQKNKQ